MNREFLKSVTEQLNAHFNKTLTIEHCKQVYGGDINQSFIIQTSEEKYLLKINDHAADDMFEKEFSGLNLLRKPACIDVPKPILFGANFIIMECITKGSPCNDFWLKFVESLAALHKQTNTQFGLYENNYIGSLSQANNYCED